MDFLAQIGSYKDWALLALRFVIGLIFFYHGVLRIVSPSTIAKELGVSRFRNVLFVFGIIQAFFGAAMIFGIYESMAAFVFLAIITISAFVRGLQARPSFTLDSTVTWEFEIILYAANMIILLQGGGAITLLRFLGIYGYNIFS